MRSPRTVGTDRSGLKNATVGWFHASSEISVFSKTTTLLSADQSPQSIFSF